MIQPHICLTLEILGWGIWFDKRRMVGSHNFKKPKEWSNNLVNDYRFGVDLFLIKFWFEFNIGGMVL
jgi:hypothetical protein